MAIACRTQATIRCRPAAPATRLCRTSQWMRTPTAKHGPERSTNESDGYPDFQLPAQAQTSGQFFP